jgi:hypothetical protein
MIIKPETHPLLYVTIQVYNLEIHMLKNKMVCSQKQEPASSVSLHEMECCYSLIEGCDSRCFFPKAKRGNYAACLFSKLTR